jgi:hypothetical protein
MFSDTARLLLQLLLFDAMASDGATRQGVSIGGDAIITNAHRMQL